MSATPTTTSVAASWSQPTKGKGSFFGAWASQTNSVAGPMVPLLAALAVGLIGFGVVMVFSASSIEATATWHDSFHFLRRQAIFACVSLVVMFTLARIDYRRLQVLTYPALGGVTA